jgi:hypothetical protein
LALLANTPDDAETRRILDRLMRDVFMVASAHDDEPVDEAASAGTVLRLFQTFAGYAAAKREAYAALCAAGYHEAVFPPQMKGARGGYFFADRDHDMELNMAPDVDDTYLNLRAYVCVALGYCISYSRCPRIRDVCKATGEDIGDTSDISADDAGGGSVGGGGSTGGVYGYVTADAFFAPIPAAPVAAKPWWKRW